MGRSGWIDLLRVAAWVVLVVMVIASVAFAIMIGGDDDPFIGLLIFVGGVVGSFLSVAGLMVFLDLAEDVRAIRMSFSNQTKEKLAASSSQTSQRSDFLKRNKRCEKCDYSYMESMSSCPQCGSRS
jgi:hypothetical protein